jgi:hypothetical protein
MATEIIDAESSRAVMPNFQWIRESIEKLKESEDAQHQALPGIVKPLEEQAGRVAKLKRLLTRERRLVTTRVWVIGAVVPLLLYVFAFIALGSKAFPAAMLIIERMR